MRGKHDFLVKHSGAAVGMRLGATMVAVVLGAGGNVAHASDGGVLGDGGGPLPEQPNTCVTTGQGLTCTRSSQCSANPFAKSCVAGHCEIPCADSNGAPVRSLCSLGETCVPGTSDVGTTAFCQTSSFTMDLNLLDSCVEHFLTGLAPELGNTDPCLLEGNLAQMLDQDRNGLFNIYDLELCVRAFLQPEACDSQTQTCPGTAVYCASDTDCGDGLYCETTRHRCERECGLIATRGAESLSTLERPCQGRLKVCDFDRGRCMPASLVGVTCHVDRDCPNGAYCFVGACAPRCSRAIECPDSSWHCSPNNTCQPNPSPASSEGFVFEPTNYSVLFGRKNVSLTALESTQSVPLLIMDGQTQRRVVSNPSVAFGYRVEVTYARKQDPKCFKPPEDWTAAEAADCLLDETEQFIRLARPFGVIYGEGEPSLTLDLDAVAAGRLGLGTYSATVTAFFTNGSRDSFTVMYQKTSLSGRYVGQLSVYLDHPDNLLGNSAVALRLFMDGTAAPVAWNALLAREHLDAEEDLTDVTEGLPVYGTLDGNTGPVFDLPTATSKLTNLVPVKGIYIPSRSEMRLVGVVEVEANWCRGEQGACTSDNLDLEVRNRFGRKLRRLVQFRGPFDDLTRRFHGMYRETIKGLFPEDVTLEGGFRLDQVAPDDSPLAEADALRTQPLLPAVSAVGFPAYDGLMDELDGEIATLCAPFGNIQDAFASATAHHAYVGSHPDRGDLAFADVVRFESAIQGALDALSGNAGGAALTVYDYLRGQVNTCDQAPAGSTCIDTRKLRCGMALQRKALLRGWLPDLQTSSSNGLDLFCPPGAATPSCEVPITTDPRLVTLQEHNRFFKELTQTLGYQAANALTNAFYVLYRQGVQDALPYKEVNLFDAWASYNTLLGEYVSPLATATLYTWPMASFKTKGNVLLQRMHATVTDRLDALMELVDLKRRVYMTADEQDFLFVRHLMHDEYLNQVYLAVLQRHWQGTEFSYSGNGPKVFAVADDLLARVRDTRNPLGMMPDEVYFENSDLTRSNWENYRRYICGDDPLTCNRALLASVETDVVLAVNDLKTSLQDSNTFRANILDQRGQFRETMASLCGPEEVPADECDPTACVDTECPSTWMCENLEIVDVSPFSNDLCVGAIVSLGVHTDFSCRVDRSAAYLTINVGGTSRPCIRGQVGALLEEKAAMDLDRRQSLERMEESIELIYQQILAIQDMEDGQEDLRKYLKDTREQIDGAKAGLEAERVVRDTTMATLESLDCMTIVGTSAGTDCPLKVSESAGKITAIATFAAYEAGSNIAITSLEEALATRLEKEEAQDALAAERQALTSLILGARNTWRDYTLKSQKSNNLAVRIRDGLFQAQQSADRYSESLGTLVDHLGGSNSASTLARNQYVQRANDSFQQLLLLTYKMTQAFIHSHNLKAQAKILDNAVFQLLTPADVRDFVATLDEMDRHFCAQAGIDCDSWNNVATLRFSVREQLFPDLRDIVDARTGKVLTKGQQFHNLITSQPFLRKRERAGKLVEQVELPFSIWLNDLGTASRPVQQWLLSPLECNHVIVAGSGATNGTLGLNAVGVNLDAPVGSPPRVLRYQMVRGNTDILRGCEPVNEIPAGGGQPRQVYPLNNYIVGYAPSSAQAQQDQPPTFVTRSTDLVACKNELESDQGILEKEACYRYFGRDRSLGAQDWKLVLPLSADGVDLGNGWVLGEGLQAGEQPIIEDLVLFFRYRSVPVFQN